MAAAIAVPLNHYPLTEILTPDEQAALSEVVGQKLNQSINELKRSLHNVTAKWQQEKVAYVHHIYNLDTEVNRNHEELSNCKSKLENEHKRYAELSKSHEDINEFNSMLNQKLALTKNDLEKSEQKLKSVETNNADLLKVVEKRNAEINSLSLDVQKLTEQLESSMMTKIEALQKVDELVSMEIEVKYREKHLLRSESYQTEQIKLLTEELERKNLDLLNVQRDFSMKYINIQSELAEKGETLKISEMKLSDLKELYDRSEKQVEGLMEKLRAEGSLRGKVEENYRVEVTSLKRIVELYKESTNDSSGKLEQLQEAVQNLQDLLKESTEKYGQLETKLTNSSRQFQEELMRRDESILRLKFDLKTANTVLESIQRVGMTDEMIHNLSPAAAAASKMFKDSQSITEMFAKHQQLQLELGTAKCDNMKLNGYIREILQDIEHQAPTLQKQKEEYERATQTVDILSSQMDVTMEDNTKLKSENVQYRNSHGVGERESKRLRGQIEDLSRQVRCLLGDAQREEIDSPTTAVQVIATQLTTFRNIEELQNQNLRLLTVVRELSEEKEKRERTHEDASLGEIRSSFNAALAELASLKEIRLRQDAQLKEIQSQRDVLTDLLKQRGGLGSTTSDQLNNKLQTVGRGFSQLKDEFDTYKIEKKENERMLKEESEKLREEVVKVRSDNSRLSGQVEYNNERAKIYNKNLEGYKKQIAVLEERNRGLSDLVARHERSVEALKAELTTSQTALSRAEVAISTITNERNLLRESKNRIQLEKEMLQRHERTSNLLQTNLEEIKNNLDMSNAAVRIKLENEIESLKNENAILKRRIDSENERTREFVCSSELKVLQMQEKVKISEEIASKYNFQVEEEINKNQLLITEVNTLKAQLNTDTNEKTKDMIPMEQPDSNLQLITLKSELESLRNQLELAKANVSEYKTLSNVLEEQLVIANQTNQGVNNEFEHNIAKRETALTTALVELESLKKEFESYKNEAVELVRKTNENCNMMEAELKNITAEMELGRSNLSKAEQELERVKSDLQRESQVKEEIRSEYETEVVLRGEEAKESRKIKEELLHLKETINLHVSKRENAEEQLTLFQMEYLPKEENAKKEIDSLKEEISNMKEACDKLEQQLIVSLNKKVQENVNFFGDVDKSNEQWLELIQFLRREKEMATSKMEMAEAQSERLQLSLKNLEMRHEELKMELGRQGSDDTVGLLTSVKQAELLRKVETLSALSDSNRLLREEVTGLRTSLQTAEESLNAIQTNTIDPLEEKLQQLTYSNENLQIQNTSLQDASTRWQKRANELIEKTNKVNPEEMKKLQEENENLSKTSLNTEQIVKKLQTDYSALENKAKTEQTTVSQLRGKLQCANTEKLKLNNECKLLSQELTEIKSEIEKLRGSAVGEKKNLVGKDDEIESLKQKVTTLEAGLDDHRNTVKQVKNIARKYKKQYEDLVSTNGVEGNDAVVALTQEVESLKAEKSEILEKNDKKVKELELLIEEGRNECTALQTNNTTTLNSRNYQESLLNEANTENERLKNELEILRLRLSLLERTFQKKEDPSEDKLTASIRPMSVKEQKTIMNIVQPIASISPVSQGQVSTSTPEFSYQLQLPIPQRIVSVPPQPHVQESDVEEVVLIVPSEEVSSSATGGNNDADASSSSSGKRMREEDDHGDETTETSRKKRRESIEEEEPQEEQFEVDEDDEEDQAEEEDEEDEGSGSDDGEREAEAQQQPANSSSLMEDDDISIRLVPSTPTLFVPRRTDGFSEMSRFTFNTLSSSREVMDEDSGSGRSVPSTPAPTSMVAASQSQVEETDQVGYEEIDIIQDNDDDIAVFTTTSNEVPSSSTTMSQQDSRSRPTPIVWDQPTSSSQGQPPPPLVIRGFIPRFPSPLTTRPQISSSTSNQGITASTPQRGQAIRRPETPPE